MCFQRGNPLTPNFGENPHHPSNISVNAPHLPFLIMLLVKDYLLAIVKVHYQLETQSSVDFERSIQLLKRHLSLASISRSRS